MSLPKKNMPPPSDEDDDDASIIVIDEGEDIDRDKINEMRRAYLEEARSQDTSE